MKRKRLVLTENNLVRIVAPDWRFGDHRSYFDTRQSAEDLAKIGMYNKKFRLIEIANEITKNQVLKIGSLKTFVIISSQDGRYLGDIVLHRLNNFSFEFSILIKQNERNKGYGTTTIKLMSQFAFENLHISKLYAKVYRNNPNARRFLENLGFNFEQKIDTNYFVMGCHILCDSFYVTNQIN